MSDHPKIHTTESGTQYVLVGDLIRSKAGWAEIQRIIDAGLVDDARTPFAPSPQDEQVAREVVSQWDLEVWLSPEHQEDLIRRFAAALSTARATESNPVARDISMLTGYEAGIASERARISQGVEGLINEGFVAAPLDGVLKLIEGGE